MPKITQAFVDKLKPKDGGAYAWDRGFGVRKSTTGALSFLFQKRINGKTPRRFTLDSRSLRFLKAPVPMTTDGTPIPETPLQTARREADAIKGRYAQGGDPFAEHERASNTFEKVARQYLVDPKVK